MAFLQLLERQPPVLLHQVDEPEVARAEDDDALSADVVLGALLLLRSPGGLPEGVADHVVLLVAAGHLRDLARRQRALDEVVEAVAVALLESGALRLAVVGEDDDLVRPARSGGRGRCARTGRRACGVPRACPAARGPSGARPRRSWRRSRRSRGALHHVREDAVHDQVADDDAHRGAHERIEAAAVSARLHVAPALPRRGGDLEDHLPEERRARA